MVRIAVTGGIACGKSLVGSCLADLGVAVCEADRLAHVAMARGETAYERVVGAFGRDILDRSGAIDRRRLGRLVFADPLRLARLNALVHPVVRELWRRWLAEKKEAGRPGCVIVPLLYEVGADEGWDAVICVSAALSVRLLRLADRGLTAHEARQRVAAQWPEREKMARADFVIVNNGTKELLRRQTHRVLEHILENRRWH